MSAVEARLGFADATGLGAEAVDAAWARRPSVRHVAGAVIGHAVMLAVMAFAMVGGHSVWRSAVAVVVFVGWAGVVAVRIRFSWGRAAVHTVVDLLAMAAVTAVPMLVSAGGGHHAGGGGGVGSGALAVGQSATAIVVASGVVAGWAVLSRLTNARDSVEGASAPIDVVAFVGALVTAVSLVLMVVMIAVGWH